MPATAIARQPDDQSAPSPVKTRPLRKQMQKALIALAQKGVTQRDAAKLAGLNETYLCTALKKPEIQAFIARKRAENIQIAAFRSSRSILELVDAESEHVRAKVALALLANSGDVKVDSNQPTVNIGVSVGYVIDLSAGSQHGAPLVHSAQHEPTPTISTTYTDNGTHEP